MIRIPFAAPKTLFRLALAACLTVGVAQAAEPSSRFEQALIRIDQRFEPPAMPIQLEDGGETHLNAGKGRVTVAVFWATWCGVCLREMPMLDALQAAMADEGVTVMPVSLDDGKGAMAKVRAYLDRYELAHLPAMIDYGRLNASLFEIRGTPTAFILDKNGMVAAAIEGPADWTSPEAASYLRQLAAEPEFTTTQ